MVLTLDVDWAPDFVIEYVASILMDAGVKATWFVTHDSSAIQELRNRPDLFELGIHPNFAQGSTHGQNPKAIVEHCMEIVPEATALKSHALLESTYLLEAVLKYSPVSVDMTTLLPGICLPRPALYEWKMRRMWRLSCCWEDNFQFCCRDPLFRVADMGWLSDGGIAVFTFHPIHVALNAHCYEQYNKLKEIGPLQKICQSDVEACRSEALGTEHVFRELVYLAASRGGGALAAEVCPRFD